MTSSSTKLLLLCAAASLLSQSAAAQAVVYPYNCDSTDPICHTACVTAVNNICGLDIISLGRPQIITVGGCTAKYMPYEGVPDNKATCLANFQKVLDVSSAAAAKCDGKTRGRVGGVLALDADDQVVKATSYAIFPATNNNPNCVVHPSRTKEPVLAKNNLLGTFYDCSTTSQTGLSRINTRSAAAAKCGLSVVGAAACSAGCALGVIGTMASFGLLGAATVAGCVICTGGNTYLVAKTCFHVRRSMMLDGPIHERAVEPAYCSGTELNGLSLSILPVCLQPPFKMSCVSGRAAA